MTVAAETRDRDTWSVAVGGSELGRRRELGRPGKGESLEQLKGMAAFIMMTDPVRGRAFMERIDKLIAASQVREA